MHFPRDLVWSSPGGPEVPGPGESSLRLLEASAESALLNTAWEARANAASDAWRAREAPLAWRSPKLSNGIRDRERRRDHSILGEGSAEVSGGVGRRDVSGYISEVPRELGRTGLLEAGTLASRGRVVVVPGFRGFDPGSTPVPPVTPSFRCSTLEPPTPGSLSG